MEVSGSAFSQVRSLAALAGWLADRRPHRYLTMAGEWMESAGGRAVGGSERDGGGVGLDGR